MSIIEESLYRLAGTQLNEATLTPEEKMDLWHDGTRKENIKACGDIKLQKYFDICYAAGYTKEQNLIADELEKRGYTYDPLSTVWSKSPPTKKSANTQPSTSSTSSSNSQKSEPLVVKKHNGNICVKINESGVALLKKWINDLSGLKRTLIDEREYFVLEKSTANIEQICNDIFNALNKG